MWDIRVRKWLFVLLNYILLLYVHRGKCSSFILAGNLLLLSCVHIILFVPVFAWNLWSVFVISEALSEHSSLQVAENVFTLHGHIIAYFKKRRRRRKDAYLCMKKTSVSIIITEYLLYPGHLLVKNYGNLCNDGCLHVHQSVYGATKSEGIFD